MPGQIIVNIANVKVMRSHDYCHFEVNLGASLDCAPGSSEWFLQVDNLRKDAARLADKAVEQYKIAKRTAEKQSATLRQLQWNAEMAESTPETERTPEQVASIKAYKDYCFEQRNYDYQDDWYDED